MPGHLLKLYHRHILYLHISTEARISLMTFVHKELTQLSGSVPSIKKLSILQAYFKYAPST